MTNEEIIEGNKLIAEFIGWDLSNKSITLINRLEFNSSWDWLTSVVEKIEQLNHPVYIHGNTCTIYEHVGKDHGWEIECVYPTKIEATYNAVIKFIEWYNKNK